MSGRKGKKRNREASSDSEYTSEVDDVGSTEDEQITKARARLKKVIRGQQKMAASLDTIFTLMASYGTRLKNLEDEQESLKVANDLQFKQLLSTVNHLQSRVDTLVQKRVGKLNVDLYCSVHD